ncbi:MAG: enoyl-CoA hydratase/isomerase family protein [Pseudomonadota bacterium]
MTTAYEDLFLEKDGDILIIALDRPEQMNSLSLNIIRNLRRAFEDFQWDPSVNVVILSGRGEKSFCAGIDLKERSHMNEEEILLSREKEIIPLFHYLGQFPKPIIGAINGVALGGGAELALICDIRIAVPGARFGQTEIRWGMIPSAGACQILRVLAGISAAKELIYTGRVIDAKEAHNLGIYSRIVSPEELIPEALNLGKEIARNSSVAVKQAKKVLDFGAGISPLLTFDFEASKECFYQGRAMEGHKTFKKEG